MSAPIKTSRRIVGLAAIAAALLVGCSSDGPLSEVPASSPAAGEPAPEEPAPEEPAPEEPAPEEPAPEEPAPEEPAPTEPPTDTVPAEDDGLSDQEWIVVVLLGLGVIGLIIAATSMAASHSERKRAAGEASRKQTNELVGMANWLLDQGSIDVLRATEASQIDMSWQSARARAVDIETRARTIAQGSDDAQMSGLMTQLATNVAGLRTALDSYASIRRDGAHEQQAALTQQSWQSVESRRQDLGATISHIVAVGAQR